MKNLKTLAEVMSIDVTNINQKKFDLLKKHVLGVLATVEMCIESNDFKEVEAMLERSPSGDGYGCDNHYIDFGQGWSKEPIDIKEVCEMLRSLKNQIEREEGLK